MTRTSLSLCLAFSTSLAMACSGGEAAREGEATPAEPRIAMAPTAGDQLPAAILGEASAPGGMDVKYLEGDAATTGYLALPEGAGPFPAVLLIHEWNGVVDRIRQIADAFAAEGYVALAADLYHGKTGANADENRALVAEAQADPDAMVANLNAAAAYLRARPDVSGRIATMGWCFGGGVALSYALDGDPHEGTAIFYGRLVDDPQRLASIHHEVYGTFAAEDQGIPPSAVESFVAALRTAGVPNDVHVYDDVNHGFWLYVDRDAENARAPALDAWQRLKAYLERTLS